MSSAKSLLKPLKRLPKIVKKLPRTVLRGGSRLLGGLRAILGRCRLLPLDTLSGKLLALLQLLVFALVLVGAHYLLARYAGNQDRLATARVAFRYVGAAVFLAGLFFVVAYALDRRGLVREVLVRSRVRQFCRFGARYCAVTVGFVVALVGTVFASSVAAAAPAGLWQPRNVGLSTMAWIFVFAFALVTTATYWYFYRQKRAAQQSCLTLVRSNEDTDWHYLHLRNDCDRTISLHRATLVDAYRARETLDHDQALLQGQIEVVRLRRNSFDFTPRTIQHTRVLRRLYGSQISAKIYLRSGDVFPIREDVD